MEIFLIVTIEEERYYWQLIGRDAARHPTILRTSPTTRNSPAKTLIVLRLRNIKVNHTQPKMILGFLVG